MPTGSIIATLANVQLDSATGLPRYRQLYDGLRASILAGRLRAETRLPSTRALASELGISRNTVLNAYAQLLAEGYVEGAVGSGTYVARTLPDDVLHAPASASRVPPGIRAQRTLSRRGMRFGGMPPPGGSVRVEVRAFRVGVPALDAFPYKQWGRLMGRRWHRLQQTLLSYGDPAGYGPLREAIAAYLSAVRAMRCEAAQVIILSGSQQALDVTARMLLDEGDRVWVEDPGYLGARGAFMGAGAHVLPVVVDGEGLDATAGARHGAPPRLVYVTPSHQYPLGAAMSLRRRLALLAWASQAAAWVVEDDYDSEYRYSGRPLAALQGLDSEGRVIYLGTFSKVLFPALRLGYMVVPPDLVDTFAAACALSHQHPPTIEQAVLADFIHEGHFARHIRRMRVLYAEQQAALVEAARRELAGLLDVRPAEAGMHLVGWLPAGIDDVTAAQRAAAHGVGVQPLSLYSIEPLQRAGLLLGYAAVDTRAIREAVHRLAQALGALKPGT
jgi:GntR family transcriptional regulator / MocR family aminotransferase